MAENAARNIVSAVEGILNDVPGYSPIDHMGAYFGSKLGYGFSQGIAKAIPSAADMAGELLGAAASNLRGSADFGINTPSAGRMGAAMASGQTITQNIQVDVRVDELEEMVEAGRFVSQLNGTRTLYKSQFAGGTW